MKGHGSLMTQIVQMCNVYVLFLIFNFLHEKRQNPISALSFTYTIFSSVQRAFNLQYCHTWISWQPAYLKTAGIIFWPLESPKQVDRRRVMTY